jgi:chromatin modification-related protein VID21
MSTVSTPWELVEAKYQRDMQQAARERQRRVLEEQNRQRQAQQMAMNAQQLRAQAQAQAQVQAQAQAQGGGQGQVQSQGVGVRGGTNGQPMPNMAPSQQQLLSAVAAANAVNARQAGPNGTPGASAARSLPGGTPGAVAQPAQVQQQMQLLQAQQLAAQQAQAQVRAQQAQQGHRVPSIGTPQGNLSASPYPQPPDSLPNGDGAHGSPALASAGVISSSPQQQASVIQQAAAMGRVGSVPMGQAQHLRVSSAGSVGSGSPQMSAGIPMQVPHMPAQPGLQMPAQQQNPQAQQQAMQGQVFNQLAVQQIVASLTANGQQPTPEVVRAVHMQMMRNVRVISCARAGGIRRIVELTREIQAQASQQQQQQTSQVGTPQAQGTPQMGVQNLQGVVRNIVAWAPVPRC